MGETLVRFQSPVKGPDGTVYECQACGRQMDDDGRWEGWIEFTPIAGEGDAVRTRRETTQPNRVDTAYWASGLTPVFLEGALARALQSPAQVKPPVAQRSMFPGPAPSSPRSDGAAHDSVLNPFSVYQKGETLLRGQLAAMSPWHLVHIILDYDLSGSNVETLNQMPQADLIELIVTGVRKAQLATPRFDFQ